MRNEGGHCKFIDIVGASCKIYCVLNCEGYGRGLCDWELQIVQASLVVYEIIADDEIDVVVGS